MLRGSFYKATSRFSASLLSAVSFWVPQMLSYGSAGVPATISMSACSYSNYVSQNSYVFLKDFISKHDYFGQK